MSHSEQIYIVKWWTESGDSGIWGYFTEEPTEGQITGHFQLNHEDEFMGEAEGFDETFRTIYWKVETLHETSLVLLHEAPLVPRAED